jgi:hypothetical protein
MDTYESLKKIWVLETDSGPPIAHLLKPMTKSPPSLDADAFKREDGEAIDGHRDWWKIYDSNAEIFDHGKDLRVSVIAKTAVNDKKFAPIGVEIKYDKAEWGVPIRLVIDVRRDKKKRIVAYLVNDIGWVDSKQMLAIACKHEVDNARPVFPKEGEAFIRTRRDQELFNNLAGKGLA